MTHSQRFITGLATVSTSRADLESAHHAAVSNSTKSKTCGGASPSSIFGIAASMSVVIGPGKLTFAADCSDSAKLAGVQSGKSYRAKPRNPRAASRRETR